MKRAITIGLLGALTAGSQAVTLVLEIDLSNAETYGVWNAIGNYHSTVDLDSTFGDHSNYTITGYSFDLQFTTDGGSWLDDLVFSVNNADISSFYDVKPFSGQTAPGVGVRDDAGVFSTPQGLLNSTPFTVNAEHSIYIETYEDFNDAGTDRDGSFAPGSKAYIQFDAEAVPEPLTITVLCIGMVASLRRRKK